MDKIGYFKCNYFNKSLLLLKVLLLLKRLRLSSYLSYKGSPLVKPTEFTHDIKMIAPTPWLVSGLFFRTKKPSNPHCIRRRKIWCHV